MMTKKSEQKCILFMRVSTNHQETESQVKGLVSMAVRDGFDEDNTIKLIFKESALKPTSEDREFQKALKATIENNNIECVYAHELSRLGRDIVETMSLIKFFKEKKVNLKTYADNIVLLDKNKNDNPTAIFYIAMLSAFAENEMRTKKERMRRGKSYAISQGRYAGGEIPYGYSIVNKHYVVNEDEAEIIRYIHNEYQNGKSIYGLYRDLLLKGKELTIHRIELILNYELYTGKIVKTKAGNDKVLPRLLSPEVFVKTQKIRSGRRRGPHKSDSIMRGIIKCSTCGYNLYNKKNMYTCARAALNPNKFQAIFKKHTEQCKNKATTSVVLVDSVIDFIVNQLYFKSIKGDFDNPKGKFDDEIEEMKQKVERHRNTIDTIKEEVKQHIADFENGDEDDIRIIKALRKKSKEKISILEDEIAKLLTEITRKESLNTGISVIGEFDDFPSLWQNLKIAQYANDEEEYNTLMYKLISTYIEYVIPSNFGESAYKFNSTKQKLLKIKSYFLEDELHIICDPLPHGKTKETFILHCGVKISKLHITTIYIPKDDYKRALSYENSDNHYEKVIINNKEYMKAIITTRRRGLEIEALSPHLIEEYKD